MKNVSNPLVSQESPPPKKRRMKKRKLTYKIDTFDNSCNCWDTWIVTFHIEGRKIVDYEIEDECGQRFYRYNYCIPYEISVLCECDTEKELKAEIHPFDAELIEEVDEIAT